MRREKNSNIIRREEIPNTDGGGIPNEERRGVQNTDGANFKQGGQRMNIEQGRKKEWFQTRKGSIVLHINEGGGGMMMEKSTRGGGEIPDEGGRGIPNEEGGDVPNPDGAGGTKKKVVRCMNHAGDVDEDGHALTVFTCNTKTIRRVVMQREAISKGVGSKPMLGLEESVSRLQQMENEYRKLGPMSHGSLILKEMSSTWTQTIG